MQVSVLEDKSAAASWGTCVDQIWKMFKDTQKYYPLPKVSSLGSVVGALDHGSSPFAQFSMSSTPNGQLFVRRVECSEG